MTDLISRDAAVACAMGLAKSSEKCNTDGGCVHAQCMQARQIATELKRLPSAPAPQSWTEEVEFWKGLSRDAITLQGEAAEKLTVARLELVYVQGEYEKQLMAQQAEITSLRAKLEALRLVDTLARNSTDMTKIREAERAAYACGAIEEER